MERYVIGQKNKYENHKSIDIEEVSEAGISGSTVVYIVSGNEYDLYSHYENIKNLIIKNNRVILIIEEGILKDYKHLCMLMASYRMYDVYAYDNAGEIEEEFAEELESRNPAKEEVENYIGEEIIAYAEVESLLVEIQRAVSSLDVEAVMGVVDKNRDAIINSIAIVGYLKFLVDTKIKYEAENMANGNGQENTDKRSEYESKVEELMNTLAEYEKRLGELERNNETCLKANIELEKSKEEYLKANSELEKKNKTLKEEKEKIEREHRELLNNREKDDENMEETDGSADKYKDELEIYKNKVMELEERIGNSGPVLSHYQEIQISSLKTKVKSVIYIKEVSYVCYMNSLVSIMTDIISKVHKLKVKLLIYDYKNDFLSLYKPIEIVGASEYRDNRDRVANKLNRMVVVQQQPGIIEDVMGSDCDVVIIYDRLRQKNDILSGNIAYKYWSANSISDISALRNAYKVDYQHVITRPCQNPECLSIGTINDYKEKTPSGKMVEYTKLVNVGNNNKRLIDIILERTNIINIGKGSK